MMRPRVKRQLFYTVVVWVFCVGTAIAFSDNPGHPLNAGASWITLPNIMAIVSLVYGAGVVREQFAELRERVTKLEEDFEKAMGETLPQTYVRQDVYEARRQ